MLSTNKKAMKCWNYGLNGQLDPLKLKEQSNKKAFLTCDKCNHVFEIHISSLSRGAWCSFCAGKKLCQNDDCKFCQKRSFASHSMAACWIPENPLSPRQVSLCSKQKFGFRCDICHHVFFSTLGNMVFSDKNGCPYCCNKKLCDNRFCMMCFSKSFACVPKSWYMISERDSPRKIAITSHTQYEFGCPCGHNFWMRVSCVTHLGQWCQFCAGKKLCQSDDCTTCLEKSFQSSARVNQWSAKNEKTPREVMKGTRQKAIFDCDVCDHDFETSIASVSGGSWCPYCSNVKLCDKECEDCEKKSMASHYCASFWLVKNDKTPRQVSRYSSYKAKFICEEGHYFSKNISNISLGRQWCPLCYKKGERKVYEALIQHYNISREKKFKWCVNPKTGRKLPFDFEILGGYKTLVELDGCQHFRQVRNWTKPDEVQTRDLFKMKLANENGYSVIRITWLMVYYDRDDWLNKLIRAIETTPWQSRAFICENSEYDVYQ